MYGFGEDVRETNGSLPETANITIESSGGFFCITAPLCSEVNEEMGSLYVNWYFSTIHINTLRVRQDGGHFPDDIFKCIFLNENVWISIKISLKFVPKGPIDNIPSLVQIMAWRWPGDKPLSDPVMASLLTHICVTWPQWVNNNHMISPADFSKFAMSL